MIISVFAASCMKDYGNYNYVDGKEIMPVAISGIADTVRAQKGKTLAIVPAVENAVAGKNYQYCWYVIPVSDLGILNRQVLSESKNLDIQIALPPDNYLLVFDVIDPETDTYARRQSLLIVAASVVAEGWYILKDINNETDFDYINTQGEMIPDVLLNLANPVGSRLKGTAVRIMYQSGDYSHQIKNEDGTVEILNYQKALYALSSEDIKTLNAQTLDVFKNKEDIFYSPQVYRPQNVYSESSGAFLMNNGKVHSIYSIMPNIGMMGAAKSGSGALHPEWMPAWSNVVVFDTESRTFYYADSFDGFLHSFRDETGPGYSLTGMDKTLVNMLPANIDFASSGFALMKSVDSDEYFLGTIEIVYAPDEFVFPFTSFEAVPEGSKMPLAAVKTASTTGSFIYFADDNRLSVYRVYPGGERESLLREFPGDETVAYIIDDDFDLKVLTNSSAGWKLYFLKSTGYGNPELEAIPEKVFEGEGTARFFMRRK
ncbi:MAG: hypothetical protein LBT50_10295 [Prevotellaceae bacterium]|nr:hypothetical protein [Prevotellaceae bacterium]